MTVYNEKTKRRVVPRWRSSIVAASSKDFQPLKTKPGKQRPEHILPTQVEDFEAAPDLGRAAELFATASRLGETARAKQAAAFIRSQGALAPSLLMDAALSVLNGIKPRLLSERITQDAAAVAHLRALLKRRPKTANLWVDLARHQAALGDTEKAAKSMQIALALAPNHRWVLRSASRLLLHAGEVEAAHRLIARHPRTRFDPWLISAEIASAQVAGKQPKFMRQARDMLRPQIWLPSHVSELATAVATVELETGTAKNARRLLKLALKDPTENALAQVEWAERDSRDGLKVASALSRTPDAYEASCWVKYNEGQLEEALEAARQWLQDESYATRPVGMVCYLASFLDDYKSVIETANEALLRHPDEVLHRNNLIFALLSQGELLANPDQAELASHVEFLRRRINAKDDDALHATANLGLLCYRLARLEDGRKLYEATMDAAEKMGNHLIRAHAAVMNSREALLSRAAWSNEALATARKLTKRILSPGLSFYMRKLEAVHKDPQKAAEILSPDTAKQYSTPKQFVDLMKDLRIEHTESGPILWIPKHLIKRN